MKAAFDEADALLDEMDGKRAEPEVGLATEDFDAKDEEVKEKLGDLGAEHVDPSVGLDTSDAEAKIAALQAQLDELKNKNSDEGGGGEGGGLVGAIGMGVTSLLPGIGGAAAGLGLLAGTGAAAFGGIGEALQAHSQATQSAAQTTGTTHAQLAQTAFSNSVAIQQAQEAVGNAYTQAAQDATSSAEQIQSAQASLTEAVRNAAQSQVQAEQAVGQAEHQLEDAQFSEQQAQESLTAARVQARITLQQLNDAEKDAALSVTAARLALAQAQQNQVNTDQNAMSTQLDMQQAALAVAQAQQQLVEAQQNATNSTAAANLANKQGVDGSQSVSQAAQAQKDAVFGVTQAQQQAADAQRNLTDTSLNNAEQIKQAQESVTQAEQQAADTQQKDAQAIGDAQRNLTDTYKEQQLAAATTAASNAQAANLFATDMGKLTPAARGFVRELLGMRGAWHQLQDTAENAVLPGLSSFLADVKPDIPIVDQAVRQMGKSISSAFGGIGKELGSKGGQDIFSGLLTNGLKFVQTVLPPFGQFVEELGRIGAAPGAQSGLANLIAGIGQGLTGVAKGIAPYTKQINEFLTAVGHIVAAIGPPLGQIVGLIAKTLSPLMKYLDAHPNGTAVKILGDIVAGMLAFKGLQTVVFGPFKSLFSGIKDGFGTIKGIPGKIKSAWSDLTGIPGKVSGAWGKATDFLSKSWDLAGKGATKVFGAGGLVERAADFTTKLPGKISGAFQTAWGGISEFGSKLGGMMVSAATSVGEFVTTYAVKLGEAAVDTGAWIAEHAVATASFVAENIVMAASATAAFVAENAATLGLVAGIAALVGAIVYLATHWQQVWSDVKKWAEDAWNFIYNGFGKYLLPLLGPAGLIALGLIELSQHWTQIWGGIKSAAEAVWSGIEAGVRGLVSGVTTVWNKLESVFKTPVNFLISTVYDDGIARLWNDVVSHIGLGSIKLPTIPKLSGGGKLSGYGGGDVHPALLEAGETVVDKDRSKALAPVFAAAGVPGYKDGGIIGDIGHAIGDVGHDIFGGAKFIAEMVSNPEKALTDALAAQMHTPATGDLAKMMLGIPRALISDLAKVVTSSGSGSRGGGTRGTSTPGGATGTVASWFEKAIKLTGVSAGWLGDLETIAHYESGDNPNAINLTDSNAAAGDPSRGIMQTIMTTFDAYHQRGTSSNIYDPVANIAAAINYIKSRYGTVGNVPGIVSLGHGGGYVGYDSGGWLMPGGTVPINQTGRPEAVLTPDESAAFVALVRQQLSGKPGGAAGGPVVTQQFFGTQLPTPEQQAIMRRDLALQLGGG